LSRFLSLQNAGASSFPGFLPFLNRFDPPGEVVKLLAGKELAHEQRRDSTPLSWGIRSRGRKRPPPPLPEKNAFFPASMVSPALRQARLNRLDPPCEVTEFPELDALVENVSGRQPLQSAVPGKTA